MPGNLDNHPWTQSLSVRQFVRDTPDLGVQSPGYQLVATLDAVFQEMMPSIPPRRGKRLDTNWGQFGILAALYFAPFKFSAIRPANLRDAWGRIDQVIPLYVFGKPRDQVPEDELISYRLVSDEFEIGPISTISDWHNKGLEKLARSFMAREQLLFSRLGEPSIVLKPHLDPKTKADQEVVNETKFPKHPFLTSLVRWFRRYRSWVWVSLSLILVLLVGWKSFRILSLYRDFKQDVDQLQILVTSDDVTLDVLSEAGPMLTKARADATALQSQAAPFGGLGRLLGWLPVYGGDLACAKDLLDLAVNLLIAGDEGFQVASPLMAAVQSEGKTLPIPEILNMLVAAQPGLSTADQAVDEALTARAKIDIERLSNKTRPLLEKIDPYLPLLRDGMDALGAIPKVLGAAEYGPQTYLVLIQNEDELRATGGFITAIAAVTVDQGEIIAFRVEDSYAVDDLSKIYPSAPWQIQEYMYLGYLLLRDSNWSPDFPVTASWAEHLYAYYSAHSVDGVVAIDQAMIRALLTVIGPLELDDESAPVTAETVIDYMRSAKDEYRDDAPERKAFMGLLAAALFQKIQGEADISWQALAKILLQALDEKHIQVQMDDPVVAGLLKARGWNGALRPGQGDYLMVVDSNLGFNKVNAAATTEIRYEVDLTMPANPTGWLMLTHHNPTAGKNTCVPGPHKTDMDYVETIARCYWDYVRVYTLTGTELLDATPHYVSRKWMVTGKAVPRRVDVLDNNGTVFENPEGLQAYGTMLVVPLAGELVTHFEFALPPDVVSPGNEGSWTYHLLVQKQAGTIGVPLSLQVHLPQGAQIRHSFPDGIFQDGVWQAEVALRTDLEISLTWQMP